MKLEYSFKYDSWEDQLQILHWGTRLKLHCTHNINLKYGHVTQHLDWGGITIVTLQILYLNG